MEGSDEVLLEFRGFVELWNGMACRGGGRSAGDGKRTRNGTRKDVIHDRPGPWKGGQSRAWIFSRRLVLG